MNNRFKFKINESEKNRIRRLHRNYSEYSVIREGMASSLVSNVSLPIGAITDAIEDDIVIPSLSRGMVISLLTGCVNDFMGWDFKTEDESGAIVDDIFNSLVRETQTDVWKTTGIDLEDDQIYFFIGYVLVAYVYEAAGEELTTSELGGEEEDDDDGLTCVREFIVANNLQDWANKMQRNQQ